MNGDGLPDIARLRSGQLLYWPGRGNGSWGVGDRDACPAGGFAIDRHVTVGNAPRFGTADAGRLLLADVNGDALSDLVEVRATDVDVYINDNGTSFAHRRTLTDTPFAPVTGVGTVRIVDVNGTGTSDLLWGRARKYEMIDLAGGVRPHLLTRIENGFGQSIDLEYDSIPGLMKRAAQAGQPWSRSAPVNAQVLTRSVVRDNL
jgi:hypothetical protein